MCTALIGERCCGKQLNTLLFLAVRKQMSLSKISRCLKGVAEVYFSDILGHSKSVLYELQKALQI